MKKKEIFFVLVFFSIVNCFAKPKYYRTKNGYSGYVAMYYQCMKSREWTIEKINTNLFILSNACGYLPSEVEKLSKAQWALFWAAYEDQYDVKKNEIYNIVIKVSGESQVLKMTFYDDGKSIWWRAFSDFCRFP